MIRPHSILLAATAFALSLASVPAGAQTVASAASLKGAYWVRYVGVNDGLGDLPVSFSGSMTFDGVGTYTVSGSGVTYNGGSLTLNPATSGLTFTVLSSGQVAIANPFDTTGSCTLFGGVGVGGVVVATSTDNYCLDMFVAIPQASGSSAATLSGSYAVGGMEYQGGLLNQTRNVLFNMNADGKGNLGNLSVTGSAQGLNDAAATQTNANATYTLSGNGSGTLVLGTPSGVLAATQLISGTKTMYVSGDGSFFVAGSPTGYDIQIGVKALSGSVNTALNGQYFTANIENCDANACGSNASLYSFGGSVNPVTSVGIKLEHQRINGQGYVDASGDGDYDFTFDQSFAPNSNGTFAGSGYSQVVGAGGNESILIGGQGDYFITVWLKVPTYSGPGVFVNPIGVINASSSAPFTAQWAPGELISIYGTGLAASTAAPSSLPFPTSFNNVKVLVNNVPAPMTVVSATQINAIIPYSTSGDPNTGLVTLQVMNNGAASNVVQNYLGLTSPGISTVPDPGLSSSNTGGIGIAAMLHQDGVTRVTTASPAKQGETISVYLTGLGAVTPPVTEGTAAPSSTLSHTSSTTQVYVDDSSGNFTQANVLFAGLAPGLAAGANQVNFTIPSGLAYGSGSYTLFTIEINMLQDADADNVQALIPVSKQ